uniref:Dr1-associated corepressor n=1 Tax=Paramormyrops kingsleyae TaxID=1676925 RepID=A0A3B3S222_9TELE
MPSKKKKYNSRFPPARIKKIMQTDEEIGKVAAAVPVIISRALELFLESLLTKACQVTQSRNAKTMTMSHLKQCIELEQQFDFLKDLVAAMPDVQGDMEDSHTEGGDRVGGKPVSGRKNGGVSTKGKEKKQSGTESEQEVGMNPVADLVTQYDHMRAAQGLALPLGNFTPMNSSLLHAVPVLPACHGNGDDDDDDEDYDC